MSDNYPPYSGQYGYPAYPPPRGAERPDGLGVLFGARIIDGLIVGIVGSRGRDAARWPGVFARVLHRN